MSKTRALLLILCLALAACTSKSAGPPRGKEGWTDDYEQALKNASAENKQVMLLFTGSDW